jgi:hypothetical protein
MYVGADVNMILTAPPAEMADWAAQFVATFTATNIRGES